MDLETLYRRTVEGWTARVEAVGPDQWASPTPCEDWDVRDAGQPRGGRGRCGPSH